MQRQQHAAQHRFIAMQQGQAPAPPDVPAGEAQAPVPPADDAAAINGEKPAEKPAEKPPEAKPEEPWSLVSLWDDECGGNWMKEHQWSVGGSTVQSYTMNFSSPNDRFNGPVTWTDRSNEYQLNQQWLYINRATKVTDEKDWDIGGRVDMIYGSNARFATQSGFEDKWNTSHSFYGLALPSAYLEFAYKKTTTKVGRFISPVGYNTVDLTQNPFNTIPYSYQYGQPFTHTGIWTQWQATDKLSIGGALIHGWDNFDNTNPNGGFMGTLTYNFDANNVFAFR